MTQQLTRSIRLIVAAPLMLTMLGGCVYTERTVEKVPGTVVVASNPSDRVVYPEGRWQLYGDGRATPYYWVWVPAGSSTAVYPPPPPFPQGR